MRVRPLPKRWLIHSIKYKGYTGKKDSWGEELYDPIVTINHVRFDDSTVFSRDQTQTKVLADAVIFVDAKHSKPVPEFKEESKITLLKPNGEEDRTYTVKKVVPCYHPHKNEIRHWELEVI